MKWVGATAYKYSLIKRLSSLLETQPLSKLKVGIQRASMALEYKR